MALSTGWTSDDRLAPIPIGLVPAHLRPLALGDTPPKPKRAAKPPYIPPEPPAARGRPPRQRKLRGSSVQLPTAPGVTLLAMPAWPRQELSQGAGLTLLCRDKLCRRRRKCRHNATFCWNDGRRELEQTLARMSDARRAGLYRCVVRAADNQAELLRLLKERAQQGR